jgi:superfamily II DNA or RNA helicase
MINAKGIGFTATPIRGDKKGLGRKADGVFDALSVTTTMFDLIKKSMLTPYKIYATGKFDAKSCDVTGGGDYNQKKLVMKVNNREIIGDAVEHYLKHTPGVPAITFCVNIEHAKAVAAQFNEAGVPSIAISSKSELAERKRAMEDFKARRILNLVNVDLLGEGYDCPAVTVVIMLRPTQSYSLFKQQLGRMLRPADGKSHGILLDHVGNTQFFMTKMGLRYPHDDPEWTLERIEPKVNAKLTDDQYEKNDISHEFNLIGFIFFEVFSHPFRGLPNRSSISRISRNRGNAQKF